MVPTIAKLPPASNVNVLPAETVSASEPSARLPMEIFPVAAIRMSVSASASIVPSEICTSMPAASLAGSWLSSRSMSSAPSPASPLTITMLSGSSSKSPFLPRGADVSTMP